MHFSPKSKFETANSAPCSSASATRSLAFASSSVKQKYISPFLTFLLSCDGANPLFKSSSKFILHSFLSILIIQNHFVMPVTRIVKKRQNFHFLKVLVAFIYVEIASLSNVVISLFFFELFSFACAKTDDKTSLKSISLNMWQDNEPGIVLSSFT